MDIQILLWLQGLRESLPGFVTTFFELVSKIAISEALVVVVGIIYWCFNKRLGQRIVITFSATTLLNNFIKLIACVYRPWIRSSDIHPVESALDDATGYSHPSGHTQTAASIFGTAGFYAKKHGHTVISILLWVFVALVAFSRIFLGVHTPQDVIVALIESILVIFFVDWFMDWVEGESNRDLITLIVALAFLALMTLIVFLKPYPLDYDEAGSILVDPAVMRIDFDKTFGVFAGVCLGWFLERRFVGFEVPEKGAVQQIIIRIVVGLAVLVAFFLAAKLIKALGASIGTYELIKNFLVLFAAAYVSPLAFTMVEQRLNRREPTLKR